MGSNIDNNRRWSIALGIPILAIALDRFMKDRIQAKGIRGEKVLVVPPWSHDDRVRFDPAGREEFRSTYKLHPRRRQTKKPE
jgi:hypothetical protein